MLNSKTIGNKISTARKKTNLSQAELAQQVSISSQAVGKWERGESMPDITTLNRLAEIFKVDLNYFSDNFESLVNDESKFQTFPQPESKDIFIKQPNKNGLNWNMSSGNWVDADFSGLKNLKDKFNSSNMKNCKFIGSDLTGLILNANNVEACDFSKANLRQSQIHSSYIKDNQFIECPFIAGKIVSSELKNNNFSFSNFNGADISKSNFKNNKIENTVWTFTSFNSTSLSNVTFNGTIQNCSFDNCTFSKVTFSNAKLLNTFFKGKKLKGILFVECEADRMTYEFLKNGKANLTGLKMVKEYNT